MSGSYQFAEFRLDAHERRLSRDGEVLRLEPKAFDLLCLLVANAGHLVTKERLIADVWQSAVVTDNSITRCVHQVRTALNDNADSPAFIETVAGAGYRFIADVSDAGTIADAPGTRRKTGTRRIAIAAISAVALLLAWISLDTPMGPDRPIERLAVLPLDNLTGDPGQAYFVQGIHEGLIAALSGLEGVDVISRTSVMRYRDGATNIPDIAGQLEVDALVEGSVARDGNALTVTVQLINADPERSLWSRRFHRGVSDVFEITTEVAGSIAAEISATVRPSLSREESRKVDPAAYDAYLLGSFHLAQRTQDGYVKALDAFRRATELDPAFAPGYLGLADTIGSPAVFGLRRPADSFPRSRELAETAIRLDSTLSDAHLTLAAVDFYWNWDWPAAESGTRRAIGLNPNSAYAYRFISEVYSVTGRHDEAIQAIRRGRQLDPFHPISQTKPAFILYLKGDYPAAIEAANAGLAFYPGFWQAHWLKCLAHSALNEAGDAIEHCERAAEISRGTAIARAALAFALVQEGRQEDAEAVLSELRTDAGRRYVSPAAISIVLAALGDLDGAFDALGSAFDERDQMLVHIDNYHLFDSLRPDPRFQPLRARLSPR